jgi:hypothetical protein
MSHKKADICADIKVAMDRVESIGLMDRLLIGDGFTLSSLADLVRAMNCSSPKQYLLLPSSRICGS